MRIEKGATAFVTGGGSGIGRGIARRLAARGVRVGVCDIRAAAAEATASMVRAAGGTALAVETDVSDFASVERAADRVEAELGPVSIVCNNAGVAMHGVPVHEVTLEDWQFVVAVNVFGVIHGVKVFVPRLLARGRPAHIVNTASIGGFQVNPTFLTGPYSMTKYAVVALTEALQNELVGKNIGLSILAPAAVATDLGASARNRPARFGGAYERGQNHFIAELTREGATGEEIGEAVAQAIEAEAFYIFTHPETRHWLEARHARIVEGFEQAATRQNPDGRQVGS
jgi:NAD(P)-dependent dehydrogenase (short-subunit alcohol dehydrogenase family)